MAEVLNNSLSLMSTLRKTLSTNCTTLIAFFLKCEIDQVWGGRRFIRNEGPVRSPQRLVVKLPSLFAILPS